MKNISLTKLLYASLAIGFLIALSISIFFISQIQKHVQITQMVFEHPLVVTNHIREARTDVRIIWETTTKAVYQDVYTDDMARELPIAEDRFTKELAIVRSRYLGSPADLDSIEMEYKKLKEFLNQAIFIRNAEGQKSAAKFLQDKNAEQTYRQTLIYINNVLQFALAKAEKLHEQSEELAENSTKRLTLFLFLSLSFGIALSLKLVNRINLGFRKIGETVKSIEDNNYIKIDTDKKYFMEFFSLGMSINKMIDSITEQKATIEAQNEEARQQNEVLEIERVRYKAIMEFATDSIHILDKNGDLIEFSNSFSDSLGYDHKETYALNIFDWATAIPKEQLLEILRSHFDKQESVLLETKHRRKDGSFIDVEIHAKCIVLDGEKYLYASSRDITEKKHIYDSRKLLLSSIGDGVYGVGADGKCTFINDAALKILGYERSEAIGFDQHELFHHHHYDGESYPKTECPIYKTLQDGVIRDANEVFIRKNGELLDVHVKVAPVVESDKVIGVVVVFQDISERIKHEVALKESEASLRQALVVKNYLYGILHTKNTVNRLLISDKSTEELMRESCNILAQHKGYRLAWIAFLVDDRIEIAAHSPDPTGYASWLKLSINPADPSSKGPSAQSIINNQTTITQSFDENYYAIWRDRATQAGLGSSICLPLRASANEKPFGTMAIYAKNKSGFLDDEIMMLETLAGDIGYAIDARNKEMQRKQIEVKLHHEQRLAKSYLDTTTTIMVALDKQGNIIMINHAGCKLLGYFEHSELTGVNWFNTCLPQPESYETVYQAFLQVMSGKLENVEYFENEVVCKNGEKRLIAWHNTYLFDEDGCIAGVLSSGEDITEKKRAEEKVLTALTNLKRAEKIAKLGSWSLDLRTNTLEYSDELYEIFEIDKEKFTASHEAFFNTVHPDDKEKVNAAHFNYLASMQEYRLLMSNGSVKYVKEQCETDYDENGNPLRTIGTVLDITKLQKSKNKLQKSEERLKLATQSGGIGIWEWNLETNELIWNDTMFALYGVKKEDFSGSFDAWRAHIHKDVIEYVTQTRKEAIDNDMPYDTEYRVVLPDNTVRFLKSQGTILRDKAGRHTSVIGINLDITEQKKKAEMEKMLSQQSKLAAMGEMVGAIAHQWRQPLTAISSAVVYIGTKKCLGTLSDEDLSLVIDDIEHQTQKMSDIINDFLNFFKPTKDRKEFGLKSVFDSILKLVESQLSSRKIDINIDVYDYNFLGHKNELEQVFLNIILNTRDAFETSLQTDKQIKIYTTEYSWKIDIVFEDNAGGIDEKILERVFEPYFTTKDEGKGTGIGLYMSKMIIEKSFDGSIVAENIYDSTKSKRVGARFIVALPREENQTL